MKRYVTFLLAVGMMLTCLAPTAVAAGGENESVPSPPSMRDLVITDEFLNEIESNTKFDFVYVSDDHSVIEYVFSENGKNYKIVERLNSGLTYVETDTYVQNSDGVYVLESSVTYEFQNDEEQIKILITEDGKTSVVETTAYAFGPGNTYPVGWFQSNNIWYYSSVGYTKWTGWLKDNAYWYYLSPASGAMYSAQWVQSDGLWYWLKSGGVMAVNEWVNVGGVWYWFKYNGAMAANEWLLSGGLWYWLKSSGAMARNESITISGKLYHFNASGACTNPY